MTITNTSENLDMLSNFLSTTNEFIAITDEENRFTLIETSIEYSLFTNIKTDIRDSYELVGNFIVKECVPGSEHYKTALQVAHIYYKNMIKTYSYPERRGLLYSIQTKMEKIFKEEKLTQSLIQKWGSETDQNANENLKQALQKPGVLSFIQKNALHHTFNNSFIKSGYYPQVHIDKGEPALCFPVNTGSDTEPQVSWIKWSELPVNKKGKLHNRTIGSFGFKPTTGCVNSPDEFHAIKLLNKSQSHISVPPGRAVIEFVTAKPAPGFQSLQFWKGKAGHSWIRAYVNCPQNDDALLMYSFGVRTPLERISCPDIREFCNDSKFTKSVTITEDYWKDLKAHAEDIQAVFLNKPENLKNKETTQTAKALKNGTCVNFAVHIFELATEKAEENDVPTFDGLSSIQKNYIKPTLDSYCSRKIISWMPELAQNLIGKVGNGYIPAVLINNMKNEGAENA